jgi:hypothetical protein
MVGNHNPRECSQRPEGTALNDDLRGIERKRATIVKVWFDRLFRSVRHFLTVPAELQAIGVDFALSSNGPVA